MDELKGPIEELVKSLKAFCLSRIHSKTSGARLVDEGSAFVSALLLSKRPGDDAVTWRAPSVVLFAELVHAFDVAVPLLFLL